MEKTKQNPHTRSDKPDQKRPENSKQKCGNEEEPFTEDDFMAALRKVSRKIDEKKPVAR